MSPPNGKGTPPAKEGAPKTATAKQDYPIPARLSGQVPGCRPQLSARDFWVLTRIVDDSDPDWGERFSIYVPPEWFPFDLSQGVPDGWELLKGEAARQFMKNMIADEMRYQREQQLKERRDSE